MRDLEAWGQQLIARTEEMWRRHREEYAFSDSGFAVFLSPIHLHPDLLIVGFNPGGSAGSFSLDDARQIPEKHEYFRYEYKMARQMRSIFGRASLEESLRNSVKTNLVFFRSVDKAQWASVPKRPRAQMENFCTRAILEMVDRLQPRAILCEGIDTFDRVSKALGVPAASVESFTDSGTRRLYCRASLGSGVRLLGMLHPTGGRPSGHDLEVIAALLNRDLGQSPTHPPVLGAAVLPKGSAPSQKAHISKRQRTSTAQEQGAGCTLLLLSILCGVMGIALLAEPDLAGVLAGLALILLAGAGVWIWSAISRSL